jgi:hypothetical protein
MLHSLTGDQHPYPSTGLPPLVRFGKGVLVRRSAYDSLVLPPRTKSAFRCCCCYKMKAAVFLLLALTQTEAASYECSAANPCGSPFCRTKNVEGWFCAGEKPIRCGGCYWDNKMIKCKEVGMKSTCAPGERCVTMLATCVVAASTVTNPSWVLMMISSLAAVVTMSQLSG